MSVEEPLDVLSEADPDTERRLGAFPNPPLDDCPVVFLGFDGPRVIFAMPEGEIRIELASKIGTMLRTDIFACEAGQSFLTYWRDSDDKFQRDLATIWFNRQCRHAGKWDAGRVMRNLGVWPGGPGVTVLHRGNEVEFRGPDGQVVVKSVTEALKARSGPLYRLMPAAPEPGRACGPEVGRWLRDHMDAWSFEAVGEDGLTGADVICGWVGLALLGGVAPFRVHVLLHARPGSGKTTFLAFVHGLLSALAGEVMNSFTDAGFRKEISGMARPVVVDEAEGATGDGLPGAVELVLNTLRLMSTGEGASRKQHDVAQTAVGAVLLAAADPPKLDQALATRVAEVRMLRLRTGDDGGGAADGPPPRPRLSDTDLATAATRARGAAPGLLGRALGLAGRYREDVLAIKAALVDGGASPRNADLIAALAAGRRLILSDLALDEDQAAEEARIWGALLAERAEADGEVNAGQAALAHLLGWDSGLVHGGRRASIGELVEATLGGDPMSAKDHRGDLKEHGLRIDFDLSPDGRPGPWLLVANQHPGVERIFGRTRWKDHRRALGYLDDAGPDFATWAAPPLTFGIGRKSRSIAIPLTPWLEKPFRPRSGDRSEAIP